jgi:hypothetical protein
MTAIKTSVVKNINHRTINTRFDTNLKNLKISHFLWKSCDEGSRKNSTERGEEKTLLATVDTPELRRPRVKVNLDARGKVSAQKRDMFN